MNCIYGWLPVKQLLIALAILAALPDSVQAQPRPEAPARTAGEPATGKAPKGVTGQLEWTLRAGFDANPRDLPEPRESPLIGVTVTGELAIERPGRFTRINAGFQHDYYNPSLGDPNGFWRAGIEHRLVLERGFQSTWTLLAGREAEEGARRTGLMLRHRLERQQGPVKLFLTTEGRMARINEANGLFGGALPDDEQFNAWTAIPGAVLSAEHGEIGVSYSATRVLHPHETDYLGLRRDHIRRQPNLFGALRWQRIALEGSLSPFTARWQASEFNPVRRMLYTAKLTVPYSVEAGKTALELTANRTVRDTTLPFASIELVTASEAKLVWQPGDGTNLFAAYLRQRFKQYPGAGLTSRTRTAGFEISRRINPRTALTLNAFARGVRSTGAEDTMAYGANLALTRRLTWD